MAKKEGEKDEDGEEGSKKTVDHSETIKELKAQNAAIMEQLNKLTASKKEKEEDDPDLAAKTKTQKEADDKKVNDTKALENALRFNLKSDEFLKTNASLLPKDVADIFKQAEKEKYENAVEKDGAIKSAIIQSFFNVQTNVDLLTTSQKTSLDEYLKLTKTGKQEKAQSVYDGLFEPTIEMLKRIKKAEALSKGHGNDGDVETDYKNRLMAHSQKHYLGEKRNA